MAEQESQLTLSVDPGRAKCGIALFRGTESGNLLLKCVVETLHLVAEMSTIARKYGEFDVIVMGDGTHSNTLRKAVKAAFPNSSCSIVDERGSTLRARQRFLEEHPPSGFGRLIPTGMRNPQVAIDDYVAVILFEEYLKTRHY